jgi:hypothetical protein
MIGGPETGPRSGGEWGAQIAVLGPLEVRDDAGSSVDLAGVRVRTLLTRLARDTGRPVSVASLVDAL